MMDPMTPFQVRALEADDWPQVAEIYAAGIATGKATFETAPPSWGKWDTTHRADLRYVASLDGRIVGWVAASDVSDRCCYAGVIEHSVYVHPDHQGNRIGRLLLTTLIDAAQTAGVWTIQNGIFPENTASVALHHACGFRTVGRRERLGQLNGAWRDVLLLEHRQPDPERRPNRRLIPVACTLDEPDGDRRIDQWRHTLGGLVTGVERSQPEQLRLTLADDPDRITQLLALAKAEKSCCSFFDFTLAIDADTTSLVIGVPPGSETILDDFARLTPAS